MVFVTAHEIVSIITQLTTKKKQKYFQIHLTTQVCNMFYILLLTI